MTLFRETDFRAPEKQAYANRRVANESTTQPASYAQRRNTGTTTVGGNMQPPSARPTYAGVMNTFPRTDGNIPNPSSPAGYNPQLTRTEIASPEETLARYVAMIKGAAQQKQA